MGRLIEIQLAQPWPPTLTVQIGDVLLFQATGGHVRSGGDVVEMLGPFVPAVLGDTGQILTPMGAPNTVMFRVHRLGRAMIEVVSGDPWQAPRTTTLGIKVES
jgi:hypothetical protein